MTNIVNHKRVAVVSPVFPPYSGGIGVLALQDAEQLRALGYAVDVYTPQTEKIQGDGESLRFLRPWFRYGNAAFVPQLFLLAKRYQVIVLEYPFFGGAEFVALRKKLGGKAKIVLSYHMDVIGRGWLATFFSWHRKMILPSVVRVADVVTVTSADYAQESFLSEYKMLSPVVVSPSVATAVFFPSTKSAGLCERYGIRSSDKVLVFVGGLDKAHYFKGLSVLLRAMLVSEPVMTKLLVVGDGDCRAEYEAFVEKHGLGNRVIFAGKVRYEELPDHYRLGEVFVFPSVDRSEAFGLVVLEALACGVPVVASNLAGVRTIVRNGETGVLVEPQSSSALAEALIALLNNEEKRAAMGRAARKMVEKEYTVERRKEQWREVLSSVA